VSVDARALTAGVATRGCEGRSCVSECARVDDGHGQCPGWLSTPGGLGREEGRRPGPCHCGSRGWTERACLPAGGAAHTELLACAPRKMEDHSFDMPMVMVGVPMVLVPMLVVWHAHGDGASQDGGPQLWRAHGDIRPAGGGGAAHQPGPGGLLAEPRLLLPRPRWGSEDVMAGPSVCMHFTPDLGTPLAVKDYAGSEPWEGAKTPTQKQKV